MINKENVIDTREACTRLIGAIIKQALDDKDYKFFYSKNFIYYCDLIDLNPSYIRRKAGIPKQEVI